MDSLDYNTMDSAGDLQKLVEPEAHAEAGTTSGNFLSTEDALLNTQVLRRRTSPARKRLSLNLSNLPPPVINLSAGKPSSGHRRTNRLSLPQRLMDLEIDISDTNNHPSGESTPRSDVKSKHSLASPSARCPRTKKNIPIVATASSRDRSISKSSTLACSANKSSSDSYIKSEPVKLRHSTAPVRTESLEKAVAAVKLRPKSPQRDAQRRSNADFRLSFEMSI